MDQICAIVDVQGFYLNKKFFAREFAIKSGEENLCCEFKPNIEWKDIRQEDLHHVKYCCRRIFGLKFYPETLAHGSDCIYDVLKYHYKKLATEDKKYFGIKNHHLRDILIACEIPYCNLEDFEFPSIKKIYDEYCDKYDHLHREINCSLHNNYYFDNLHCAKLKCNILWEYLYEKLHK